MKDQNFTEQGMNEIIISEGKTWLDKLPVMLGLYERTIEYKNTYDEQAGKFLELDESQKQALNELFELFKQMAAAADNYNRHVFNLMLDIETDQEQLTGDEKKLMTAWEMLTEREQEKLIHQAEIKKEAGNE